MINFLSRKNVNWNLMILTICIITLFLHGKVPYMLFVSVVLFFLTFTKVLYSNKKHTSILRTIIIHYTKKTWLYLLTGLIFFIAVIFNEYKELILIKELLYSIYIWAIIGILYLLLKLRPDNEILFSKYFQTGYILLFFLVIIGIFLNFSNESIVLGNLFGYSVDYNFLAFSLLMCLIIIIYRYRNLKSRWMIILGLVYLTILLVTILLTGSRRGIFFLGLLHIFLFGYLFWSIYKKSIHLLLFLYFITIVLILFSSSVIFYTGSAAFKSYLIERIFPNNYQQVKSQYSYKLYRYSTILNKDSLTSETQYNNDWNYKPFKSKSWINTIIFKNIYRKFKVDYNQDYYDDAFKRLVELRNFSSSFDQFREILPKDYKSFFNEEFVLSDSFQYAPYLYPIPYVDKDLYIINSLENIYPIKELKKANELPYYFVKTKAIDAKLSLLIPFIPNTANSYIFSIKGVNPQKLKLSLIYKNLQIPIKKIDISDKKEDGFYIVTLKFNLTNENNGFGRLIVQPDIQLKDTLIIGNNWHKRFPLSGRKTHPNSLFFVKNFDRLNSEKLNRYNNYYQRYISEFKRLSKIELDSLNDFLENIDKFKPNFIPYGSHSITETKNLNFSSFKASGYSSFTRCFAVLPAIADITYNVELNVKSEKTPDIYIKRFPERTIFNLTKKEGKKVIEFIGNNTYHIHYQYHIDKSSSALGALIIGIRHADVNDIFEISDFNMNISKDIPDIKITPYQYSFLESYITSTLKLNNINIKGPNNYDYLRWIDKNEINKDWAMYSRIVLWKFAYFYFKDYSLKEKLFGKGFEYLEVYKGVFNKGNDKANTNYYPHNPIISSLLYSGIFGALIYILFLVQVFYRYLKLRKRIALFAVLYLLAFAFTFFSGNSHFSVPAFTLLSLVPFVFDYAKNSKKGFKNN